MEEPAEGVMDGVSVTRSGISLGSFDGTPAGKPIVTPEGCSESPVGEADNRMGDADGPSPLGATDGTAVSPFRDGVTLGVAVDGERGDGAALVSRRARLGLGLVGDTLSDASWVGRADPETDGIIEKLSEISPGMVVGDRLPVFTGHPDGNCDNDDDDGSNQGAED